MESLESAADPSVALEDPAASALVTVLFENVLSGETVAVQKVFGQRVATLSPGAGRGHRGFSALSPTRDGRLQQIRARVGEGGGRRFLCVLRAAQESLTLESLGAELRFQVYKSHRLQLDALQKSDTLELSTLSRNISFIKFVSVCTYLLRCFSTCSLRKNKLFLCHFPLLPFLSSLVVDCSSSSSSSYSLCCCYCGCSSCCCSM